MGLKSSSKKWLKYRKASLEGMNSDNSLLLLEDIIYEIRKDVGQRKKLDKGDMLSIFINDVEKIIKKLRILQRLKDIERNRYEGMGKPERLSGDLVSYWSRRTDDANRTVYRIEDNTIKIV